MRDKYVCYISVTTAVICEYGTLVE